VSTVVETDVTPATVAAEQAMGLRKLADLLEAHPELAATPSFLTSLHVWWAGDRDHLAALARAGKEHGAQVEKIHRDDTFSLALHWGPVIAHALAQRDVVCERVVVGRDEVTETVPDPEALAAVPMITRTTTVERTEWRCGPLLTPAVAESA
jgi:hypothetical protein